MWHERYDALKQLITLNQTVEKHAADINQIQRELKELTAAVQHLAYEVRRTQENEAHEREKVALRLENALLRFERRLPPGSTGAAEDAD